MKEERRKRGILSVSSDLARIEIWGRDEIRTGRGDDPTEEVSSLIGRKIEKE
jgi:hypothetical protein